jgi:hypothetical protein
MEAKEIAGRIYQPYRGKGHMRRYVYVHRSRNMREYLAKDPSGTCDQLLCPKTGELTFEGHYQRSQPSDIEGVAALRFWDNGEFLAVHYDHGHILNLVRTKYVP